MNYPVINNKITGKVFKVDKNKATGPDNINGETI